MKKLIEITKTIFISAPATLTSAVVIVAIISEEIASVLPNSAETVGQIALVIITTLGAVIAVIRRVTPVLKEDRGILPQ